VQKSPRFNFVGVTLTPENNIYKATTKPNNQPLEKVHQLMKENALEARQMKRAQHVADKRMTDLAQ